jgi:hypothetical protein
MIRVYTTPGCRARCITFEDEKPPAPLELVREFRDEEREAAWRLLPRARWPADSGLKAQPDGV